MSFNDMILSSAKIWNNFVRNNISIYFFFCIFVQKLIVCYAKLYKNEFT